MPLPTIYTERNNCQDCYKCIRHCPVKAIKIEDHSASIISNLCLYCGKCVQVCPANAKKVRNDLNTAKYFLSTYSQVVLSLAPSYKSEFADYSLSQLLERLHQLGFYAVSETALGAELVSLATNKWLNEQADGIYFSSCCPSVVRLIQKYYPDQISRIAPVDSPMQAHAKFLKKVYGSNTRVIFAGPCISKKQESEDFERGSDLVLTFAELREWLKEKRLMPDSLSQQNNYAFAPYPAKNGNIYPVEGGMIATMKEGLAITDTSLMSFSGVQNIKEILEKLPDKYHGKLFVELMACEGGCVNGPLSSANKSLAEKRIITLAQEIKANNQNLSGRDSELSISADYSKEKPATFQSYNAKEIQDTLRSVGKISDKDELNCGGCGYESCRRFAEAILDGKAERTMCVSYMRKVAHNKATVLLQKMPYGVVLIDDRLKIIESNQNFARILGCEATDLFNVKPGMEGVNLKKLTPLYKFFANALEKGLDGFDKEIRVNNELYHLSIFSIQQYKIVCGIVNKPDQQHYSQKVLTERLQQVISENLATAQKAAFLLGENASRTESMLYNIIDSYQSGNDVNR